MIVNDVNDVSRKGPNWTKLTKVGTYLSIKTKLVWI